MSFALLLGLLAPTAWSCDPMPMMAFVVAPDAEDTVAPEAPILQDLSVYRGERERFGSNVSHCGSDTLGTLSFTLEQPGIDAEIVFKINEGRPHVGDELLNRRITLVINTPLGRESFFDDKTVRSVAMLQGVPAITTLTGAAAAVSAIEAIRREGLSVKALQDYHQKVG